MTYMHILWCGVRPSGEYAFNKFLLPFGYYAVKPLQDRIQYDTLPMQLTFIYGEPKHDWMNWRACVHLIEKLNSQNKFDVTMHQVPDAGLY